LSGEPWDVGVMTSLTNEQVNFFNHNGFLSPIDLLLPEELKRCQEGLLRFEDWLGAPVNHAKDFNFRSMNHCCLPWIADLAHDPRILDPIEALIGPDIMIYTSTFFIKDPGSPAITAWHQDSTYYGLTPPEEVTVWIALTNASEEAGCLEALTFNGRPSQMRHAVHVVEHSVNRAAQSITDNLKVDGTLMPLEAGQFSMHHGLCLHRSAPNRSSERRVGLGMNFISPSLRGKLPEKPCAMLVRGEDRFGNFEHLPRPQVELDAPSLVVHKRAIERYARNYREEESRHSQEFA
jgi:non-heme Fe2+,alpha-ketoglutarate-dependent halogenase